MKVKKAVIPAAGLGTRMLPATKTVPKEMLPLVDKPVIQYIIEEAVAAGIEDILIVTNRAKSAMDDYFDYYPELETRLIQAGKDHELTEVRRAADLANIFYVRQKETKGLGHAIWRAKRFVGDEPFAVLLGDDIMKAKRPVIGQLIEASEKHQAAAVGVQYVPTEAISKYSSVKVAPLEDRVFAVSDMNEKPTPQQMLSMQDRGKQACRAWKPASSTERIRYVMVAAETLRAKRSRRIRMTRLEIHTTNGTNMNQGQIQFTRKASTNRRLHRPRSCSGVWGSQFFCFRCFIWFGPPSRKGNESLQNNYNGTLRYGQGKKNCRYEKRSSGHGTLDGFFLPLGVVE